MLAGLLGVSFVVYWFLGVYELPRYAWYSVRADFEVDGEPISVGGTVECRRKRFQFFPLDRLSFERGGNYRPSTTIFAERLVSGGVLIITPPWACQSLGTARLAHEFPPGYYPTAIWLDDPSAPTRAEAYLSDAYYLQPDARVRLTGFTTEYEGSGAFALSTLIGNWRHRRLEDEVPWLRNARPEAFRGYVVTVAEEEQWAAIPGLRQALDGYQELTRLTPDLPIMQEPRTRHLIDSLFHSAPRHSCRATDAPVSADCIARYQTFGMTPHPSTLGAAFSNQDRTVGSLDLIPMPETPPTRPDYRYEIDGSELTGRIGVSFYAYHPGTKQLLSVRSMTFEIDDGPRYPGDIRWRPF